MLHSRPAVVNYGGSTGVVVFYGANDGMLHAISGNSTGTGAGEELWSFVPQEMFGKLNRLRINTPEVRLPSTPASSPATPRDYFIDGPIGVYQRFAADGTVVQAIIFVGMRRGGRLLYAFDVTHPAAPALLWKKTPAELPLLGQSWSEPKVARIKGNVNPVLVFGAGYDAAAEDASCRARRRWATRSTSSTPSPAACCRPSRRRARVPADLSVIDSDFDGYIDRAYGVDLAGMVYRIDFEVGTDNAPAAWTKYTLADLSGGTEQRPQVLLRARRDRDARLHGADARLGRSREAAARQHAGPLLRAVRPQPRQGRRPATVTSDACSATWLAAGATSNTNGAGLLRRSSSRARRW